MFGTGLGQYFPILLYICVLVGSIVSLSHPRFGVYVLALILPLQGGRTRIMEYPFGNHALDLLFAGVIFGLLLWKHSMAPPRQMRGLIIGLCAITYLTLWLAPVLSGSIPLPIRTGMPNGATAPFGSWIRFMHLPLMYIAVCASIRNKRQMQILLLVMMVAFLWNAKNFYGNVGHRETGQYSESLRNSMGEDFGGSNGRAAYASQCTLFLIALFGIIKSVRIRIIAGFLIFAGLYAVMFSYSRGAYAGFVLGLVYLAVFRIRWLLVVLLIGVFFAGALLPTSVVQRVTMTYEGGELDTSSALRVELWQYALDLTTRNPILGIGYDCFRLYRAGFDLKDTHNMYLKALVETGVLGVGCLVLFMICAFVAGHRLGQAAQDPFYRALGSGFAAYMVSVIITNIFGDRWTYLDVSGNTWVLLGLVVIARKWITEPTAENAEAAAVKTAPLTIPRRAVPARA